MTSRRRTHDVRLVLELDHPTVDLEVDVAAILPLTCERIADVVDLTGLPPLEIIDEFRVISVGEHRPRRATDEFGL